MSEQNKGHGHVIPRPDGDKTRCGGPKICKVCQQEQRDFAARTGASIFDVITGTAQGMKPSTAIGDTQLDEMRRDGFSIDGDNAYKRDLLDCVVGALAFGKQGNPAPPEGHWLHRFWEIGDAERKERDELRARLAEKDKRLRQEQAYVSELAEEHTQLEARLAQLAAQQAAVPVGRELLERIAGTGCDPDCCIAYERGQLRARLNTDRSAQGGE